MNLFHSLCRTPFLSLALVSAISIAAIFYVPAYAGDGSLDAGFGTGGIAVSQPGRASESFALAVQPDGKVLQIGATNDRAAFGLTRYLANGQLDGQFGNGGMIATSFNGPEAIAYSGALQPDGKILVAGSCNCYNPSTGAYKRNFAFVRYNPDGSLDSSFGAGGKQDTDFGFVYATMAYSIALLPDGKFLATGFSFPGMPGYSVNGLVLARYLANGQLDVSFGNGGWVLQKIAGIADYAFTMAMQTDGKILLAGQSHQIGSLDFFVARYLPAGGVDPSFGNNGIVITHFAGGASEAHALALQPDGKILLVGQKPGDLNTDGSTALVRYNVDGSLDGSFGNNGIVSALFTTGYVNGYAVAVQPDGKIILAGYLSKSGTRDLLVMRYNPDGSKDSRFNGSGGLKLVIGDHGSVANALALQPDGKILASGSNSGIFTLVRLLASDANNDGIAEPWDLTPAPSTFLKNTSTESTKNDYSSRTTITGLGTGLSVPITIAGGMYAINGGAYRSEMGYVKNGDVVLLRPEMHLSTNSFAPAISGLTTITVGGLPTMNNPFLFLGERTSSKYSIWVNCVTYYNGGTSPICPKN